MDIHILNVRDTLERVMYLQTQLRVTMEFSPLKFCEGTPTRIHLYGRDSFKEACEAYQISDRDIKRAYHDDGDMVEYFRVRDFEIFALIAPDEEGYVAKKGRKKNADK